MIRTVRALDGENTTYHYYLIELLFIRVNIMYGWILNDLRSLNNQNLYCIKHIIKIVILIYYNQTTN